MQKKLKKSDILKKAKKHLDDGASRRTLLSPRIFICLCIKGSIPTEDLVNAAIAQDLVNEIESRLGKWAGVYRTCYEYLRDIVGVHQIELTPQAVQQYRHAWVDELIREFESQGD